MCLAWSRWVGGNVGSELRLCYAADLFFLSQIIPESFRDGCAGFGGDTPVTWVHAKPECAPSVVCSSSSAPSRCPSILLWDLG